MDEKRIRIDATRLSHAARDEEMPEADAMPQEIDLIAWA